MSNIMKKVVDFDSAMAALENIQTFPNDRDAINDFMDTQLDDTIYEIREYVEELEKENDSLQSEVKDLQDQLEEWEGNNA